MKGLFYLLLSLFIWNGANAQLYINEWMASNSSVIEDPDFEETADWIEIYNPSITTIQLEGYFLTDNLDNPDKWSFPSDAEIPPLSHLIIWADGMNTGLHSSFKLTKAGEKIGLFNSALEIVDSVIYSNQKTNVSMGRVTDGSSEFAYFLAPSPGNTNDPNSYEGITFHESHFSSKGGFYETPISVTLSTIAGDIRFTTDGSVPTTASTLYSNPIEISETTILRARVFQDNFIPGKPITHSYFFGEDFEQRKLPVVSIATEPGNFWDPDTGLYVQDFKPDWEYPINVELFENDGSNRAAFSELAGTKVNGLNSWASPHKMLGISFDNDYDQNNLEYQLFFDRDRKRYDHFILRASGSDWNSTLLRDPLCQALTNENMDIEKMGYRPSIVFVNGEYLGIHNLRSRIDGSYIEENFGYASGEYDLIQNFGEVDEGDDIAFFEWYNFFENNDLSLDENFEQLELLMDVPNFTDYMISQMWSSNSSWGHNIQLWRPKEDGGKWRWLMEDFDRGFVGINDASINLLSFYTDPESGYEWARLPLKTMFNNQAYKERFYNKLAGHLYTSFHPERVIDKIEEFKSRIEVEIPRHVEEWEGQSSSYGTAMPSVAYWEEEIEELKTYAQGRQQAMIEDMIEIFELEPVVDLSLLVYPPNAGKLTLDDLKIPKNSWSGPYFNSLSVDLEAKPEYGYEFTGWTTGVSELSIEADSEWKYTDTGIELAASWINLDYDDSNWSTGFAEFGYGNSEENTEISYGDDSENKHISYQFRKKFTIENIEAYTDRIQINLIRDDGAVVYLNGEEILRSNMPSGEIDFETTAFETVGGEDESTYFSHYLHTDLLQEGENVIAVQIHQVTATSSDISFNLEMRTFKVDEDNIILNETLFPLSLASDTFLIANFNQTETCLLPREIHEDLTLDIACSPYFAPYDVKVFPEATLNIPPGVEIQFGQEAKLVVNGTLNAIGTEDSMILFKPILGYESWGAIVFNNTSDLSQIHWAEIKKATNGEHPIYENAAISAFHSALDLNHLQITEVLNNPILAYYSDITLQNSQLHSEVTGDLINVKYGNALIENCDFRGNFEIDTDAIDYDEVNQGIIRDCKIYDFFGFNSDGIDLGEESTDILLENNFIHNCTDKGVSIGQQSSLFAKNNTIVNCNQGFAVKDLSIVEVDQSTFYNTAIPIACFEKNIGLGGGMAFVNNSILSNASIQTIYADPYSMIDITYSLSDNDTLLESNNLFANPSFVNPNFLDFNLQNNSPAINYGVNDLGSNINLGADLQDLTAEPSLMISGINYHPTGYSEAEFIQIFNPSSQTINLESYVLSEAVDFIFPPAQIAPQETIFVVLESTSFAEYDNQIFQWTTGRLSNDGETIRLTDPYGIIVDQVIYNDQAPWPIEADGIDGYLILKDPSLDNHFAESWTTELDDLTGDSTALNYFIEVYPNPATNFVRIHSNKSNIYKAEVINTAGQILKQFYYDEENKIKMNVRDLPTGNYFIRINEQEPVNKLTILK